MEKTKECQWVIGAYQGERAKSIEALAGAGIYYIISSESSGASKRVLAAFRKPIDGPLPDHLQIASIQQQEKLEKWFKNK